MNRGMTLEEFIDAINRGKFPNLYCNGWSINNLNCSEVSKLSQSLNLYNLIIHPINLLDKDDRAVITYRKSYEEHPSIIYRSFMLNCIDRDLVSSLNTVLTTNYNLYEEVLKEHIRQCGVESSEPENTQDDIKQNDVMSMFWEQFESNHRNYNWDKD